MQQATDPLNELIRKVESNYNDPKTYGDGFVVIWHKGKHEVVEKIGVINKLFAKNNFEYYFVKTQIKPIVIKGNTFKWEEGTSDIALDFDAIFKLKVTNEKEAAQLVTVLSQAGNAEQGIYRLVDKYMHAVMSRLYEQVRKANQNLLDKFYQGEIKRGECDELNSEVSAYVRQDLAGSDFSIGFTLINAPERHTYFKYKSDIEDTDLKVDSECQLTLTNYQAYRKSAIKNDDEVKAHMIKAIDSAIKQHIIGKSPMELLSNFKTKKNDKESISQLVRSSVQTQAQAIGYDLKSFHTLPASAPLKLLTGIIVDIEESDAAFKAGHFGGSIRLNISMEVKAKDGEFDKHKHLFYQGDNDGKTQDQSTQFLQIKEEQIVNQIKKPVIAICSTVIRNHSHLEATTQFDDKVRPELEKSIIDKLSEQHGLEVHIKSLQPRESEEASRLQELLHEKRPFSFKYISRTGTVDTPFVTFKGGFEVIRLEIENQMDWNSFEGHDFGYRSDSPERTKIQHRPNIPSGADEKTIDRLWKNNAIERELKSIEEELIRYFESSDLFVIDLNGWINDPKYNRQMQDELITRAEAKIKTSRGLVIRLERLAIVDDALTQARIDSRQVRLDNMLAIEQRESALRLEQINAKEKHRATLTDTLVNKKIDLIEEDVEGFSDLEEQENNLKEQYENYPEKASTLNALVPLSTESSQQQQQLLDSIFPTQETNNDKNNDNSED